MRWDITGVIEGFYGTPWTWEQRSEVARWCHERGMNHYVYAPKDDPKHRADWRTPYDDAEVASFASFVAEGTLRLGFAVSPGLTIDYGSEDDRRALLAKLTQMIGIGADLVCLALDDIPPREGLGAEHAELCWWLREELDPAVDLVLVPTDYTSIAPTPYLDQLADRVPGEVPIAWTGPTVVCDRITREQANLRMKALGGRPPLIWENYPVNDSLMGDRLFLGPLRGRDPDLAEECSGFLANPMTQPRASKLPLASVCAYLRDDDLVRNWEAAADELGLRTFASACDGRGPMTLVESLIRHQPTEWSDVPEEFVEALASLRAWCEEAQECEAPGLEDEVGPWVEQVHQEAGVARVAVRAIESLFGIGKRADSGADHPAAVETVMATIALWQAASRSPHSVLGPRRSFRPVLSHNTTGAWRFHRESVLTDQNSLDRLVHFTMTLVDRYAVVGPRIPTRGTQVREEAIGPPAPTTSPGRRGRSRGSARGSARAPRR